MYVALIAKKLKKYITLSYCVCHGGYVEVRWQLGVSSFLLPRGSQRLNSGYEVWQQTPLSTEPSDYPAGLLQCPLCWDLPHPLSAFLLPADLISCPPFSPQVFPGENCPLGLLGQSGYQRLLSLGPGCPQKVVKLSLRLGTRCWFLFLSLNSEVKRFLLQKSKPLTLV